MFERESHVCVSLDAGRIFGEDLLMSVLWASGAERDCWAPPQARFFLKHGHAKIQVLEK